MDLLHPVPGAMRVTRDGVCRDKPMTVTAYLNHINMCFAAVLEMHRAEGRCTCGKRMTLNHRPGCPAGKAPA